MTITQILLCSINLRRDSELTGDLLYLSYSELPITWNQYTLVRDLLYYFGGDREWQF